MSSRSERDGSVRDIHQKLSNVRLDRLRKLIDLYYDGVVTDLIKDGDEKEKRSYSSYVSQIQSGHRPFGERAARKLEAECGKPVGWLDGIEDPELQVKEGESERRVNKLREYIDEKYEGSVELFLAENPIGHHRKTLIRRLLLGTRFMSLSVASAIEKDCGMEQGYLSGE